MKRAGTAALIGTAAALGAVILAQEGRKVTGVVKSARTRQPVVPRLRLGKGTRRVPIR